jgi:hypothetical protein
MESVGWLKLAYLFASGADPRLEQSIQTATTLAPWLEGTFVFREFI